ncbi:CLUMA_CG005297, isoform A [Clunio marinus]|uniref:FACT complex subunit SSRP1 n=1 Tax=Clunio marinus TaxID=568069 RepID=A0A1J1HU98_9DIPT|nr:CLUMA_CG005297, isoform A [Clunio marinus]
MDFLEFNSISSEHRGYLAPGKIKLTNDSLIWKSEKTGKVEQITPDDIDCVNFQKFVGSFGLRIFLKNGSLHRFIGFKDDEKKIADFFKKNYELDMLEKELSMRGWNWGTVNFKGDVLSFNIGEKTSFEIPLSNVSQCTTGKNEVTLEFHQNDDAPVSLMEMRYHIPTTESSENDPVDAFYQNVINKASVLSLSGDAIAIFREIQCLTPRGRYDIKVFQSFFQLHGKTFDYKIPLSTVLRLFLLPHKDNRQMFFVVSLDPPIKQGQTRYHFLVLLFGMEEETSIELPFTEKELKEKYDDKLTKELSGPVYEVLGKIMKVIINRKLTGPGSFLGHSGTPAVGCSFKAAAGYLYPLERGFIYVHKPPMHIRFEEIACVNFARGGGSTKSFDFEIELKSGTQHTFSSIEKEEYAKLYDFIVSKKITIKNSGKMTSNYADDFGDSDKEEPDAYLARVKAEAEERDSDESGSDEESTDEDFNPNVQESDVAEEFDSNVSSSDSDAGGSDDSSKAKKKKEKKEKHREKKSSSSPKKSKKSKKDRDENAPKRATTAFMAWLNDNRENIKKDNPGIKITEIAKKGGEMWSALKDKSKWEEKASKDKERYAKEMEEYKASGGSTTAGGGEKRKKEKEISKVSPTKVGSGAGFKSKEYISEDESSSDGENKKKKKKTKKEESSASEVDDD